MATVSRGMAAQNIHVDYDRESDVLYIALGNPVAAISDYVDGIIYRYSETGDQPCGATIVGFKGNKWDMKSLAKDVATHLHIKASDLMNAISKI